MIVTVKKMKSKQKFKRHLTQYFFPFSSSTFFSFKFSLHTQKNSQNQQPPTKIHGLSNGTEPSPKQYIKLHQNDNLHSPLSPHPSQSDAVPVPVPTVILSRFQTLRPAQILLLLLNSFAHRVRLGCVIG